MADEGFKRKLTAILSADVIGYSRLMRDDEEATVRDIASHRVLISEIVQQHHGRVVDSPGDNILAEFASVVDAVNGAVKIQEEIKKSNSDTPKDRRMEFRIGINLGDVIEEEARIYGDGVNIAARVEGLASAGGIAISGTVYEHIKEKLSLGYHYLGEQDVKNISEPVRVYRLLTEPEDAGKMIGEEKPKSRKSRTVAFGAFGLIILIVGSLFIWNNYFRTKIEPASVEKMAFPLPEKPSIAVLPFDNMSGDPTQEFFSDGLTEEIISALSKTDQLFVIARNSSFTYKGKPVKVKQVAEELGVRYVLEGSVRKSEDRVRVTAQLIDAITGHHMWAERYDRDLKDIFALQDEITLKIITALQVELSEGEQFRGGKEKYQNLDVLLKLMEIRSLWREGTKESIIRVRQIAQEMVDTAPESPYGYQWLAWTNWFYAMHGKSPRKNIKKAFELAQKTISLAESNSSSHVLLGQIYLMMRQYEKAIAEGVRSVELNPNGNMVHGLFGSTLCYAGKLDEGIDQLNQGIRLGPFPDNWYYYHLGRCYRQKGQYEIALTEIQKSLQISPEVLLNRAGLAAVYALLDRQAEAEAEAQKVLEINPNFSIERVSKGWPYKNPADLKIFVNAMIKAGLPFKPPLPLPDKPSIAVLAFDNLSGDPEQEYFSDGITEEVISSLSKTDQLFVIARNSSFVYKGKPVNVKQVARELGVRYVLEGSVRKYENRVRITAQLIDATKGNHLWSERYDRDLKDIFALQDEITLKIVTALQVKLTEGEQMRIWAKRYKSLDVQLKAMELMSLWRKGTVESLMRHGQVAQELIKMAPETATGYSSLGWHYWYLAIIGKSPRESIAKAFKLAQKALSLDESNPSSYSLLSNLYAMMRQYDKAIAAGERGVALNPNGALNHCALGITLSFAGKLDKAIDHLKRAIRLDPFPEYYFYTHLGRCYRMKGQYEAALSEFKKALHANPDAHLNHVQLAAIYALLDRQEEADAAANKVLEINPSFSVEKVKAYPYKNQADLKLLIDALRKAGLPEKSN